MSVCLVSVYHDLQRHRWRYLPRKFEEYLNSLACYLHLNHPVIIYVDAQYATRVRERVQTHTHIQVIPLTTEFWQRYIWSFQHWATEKKIMALNSYQRLISHRRHHPECSNAAYNILQHSKVDFLMYTMQHVAPNHDFYAWTDAGYFLPHRKNIPPHNLNTTKFHPRKVNLIINHEIVPQDADRIYTLRIAPEKVSGNFFLCPRALLPTFQETYHQILLSFYREKIVDDDRHILLRCLLQKPELFKTWHLTSFFEIYTAFA